MPGNDQKNKTPEKEPIIGRVDNPGEKYKEEQNKRDISQIDRQEGSMNNGQISSDISSDENKQQNSRNSNE